MESITRQQKAKASISSNGYTRQWKAINIVSKAEIESNVDSKAALAKQ